MAPDAGFSNISDKHEFTKFAKFLAYKGVQVIVESRKGLKIESNVKTNTSDSDWFNLQIPDDPDVIQATKAALPSHLILETIRSQLHVEISVRTEDGDDMVLELWTLELDDTQFDTSLKAMNTVYFRMGILLKSLITITRITPAYHLSRKQQTESFTILYRIYSGVPTYKALGDSVKKLQAGLLKTPLGGLCFSVSFRTNFSISPNPSVTDNSQLLVKSDHFELSPKHVILECKKKKEKEPRDTQIDLKKPLRPAAFVDDNYIRTVVKEFFEYIPIPVYRERPKPKTPEDTATDCKSTQDLDRSDISKSPTAMELPPKKFPGRNESEPPFKLLHFPFANDHYLGTLAEFYKDLFNARHLKTPNSKEEKDMPIDFQESVITSEELSKDLAEHESSLPEFDELLADMCKSAEWSGN